MERVKTSIFLRIAFDLLVGLLLLVGVAVFMGSAVDLPITILASFIVVTVTVIAVRQNYHLVQSYMS